MRGLKDSPPRRRGRRATQRKVEIKTLPNFLKLSPPQSNIARILTVLVLGIETSCDETAAAIVRDGREIVSSVIASQIETHKRFGGVVPELASREQLDKIVPIVDEAFTRAEIKQAAIHGIAVTIGPGLV